MMNKSSLILLLFSPFLLLAQEQDFQLWTKVGLSHSLNKTVKLSFDQGYRLRENAALSDALFSNLSIRYKINKPWSAAVGYRYINDFDYAMQIEVKHRLFADLNYRKKHKRWEFKNRLRYQLQSEVSTLRDKVSATYNVRKTPLEPFTAFEVFYREQSLNKWRYTLGASYPLSKDINLSLYYRLQQSINSTSPQLYILGVGFDYDF
jgi:predicted porin